MITVTLKNPKDSTSYSLTPMAITIPRGELNENLQHVAQTCQLTAAYEPEILEILALRTFVKATVEDETGTLFTGIIDTGATWTDNGFPTPIDSLQLKINDNTYLLEKQTEDEVALINTTLKDVIEKICSDCNITISPDAKLPVTQLKAFIMDTGTSYLQTLNNILFQHELAFIFTGTGELSLIDFSAPPEELPVIGQDKILTGFSPTRTAKKYGAVKIGYTLLTQKKDQQVYFEGNDLGEDNKVVPITVRPGQYYPYEADPTQEAREGQVYQEFAEGYAESYQAYNGETKYRRSQKTSLLYTENQRLVQDWEGSIVVDRTAFQARRAAVRLKNNGTKDANLLQLAIRADAWYREPTSYVTAGSGNEYLYEGEYLYTPEAAEKLSKTLSRFFLGGNFKLSGRLTEPLGIGQFVHIDTGLSGFQADALCLSCSFEPESEIYSVQLITYGDIAIDIQRYKNYVGRGDPNAKITSDMIAELQSIVDGNYQGQPPAAPYDVQPVASQNALQISFLHSGVGLDNTISFYVIAINRGNDQWTTYTTDTTSSRYEFDRTKDGYPEKSDLEKWKIKVKAVNIYGKESVYAPDSSVDTTKYLSWKVTAPQAMVSAEKDWIDFSWHNENQNVYGTFTYELYEGERLLGTTKELSYRYWFNRAKDGYPEKADILALNLKIKVKNETDSNQREIAKDNFNLAQYLSWEVVAPQAVVSAEKDWIDFSWHNENQNVYGTFTYELYEGERLLGTTKELSYRYWFNRAKDGYPEKADILALNLKIKVKNETDSNQREIAKDNFNLAQYLSWEVVAPQAVVSAEKDWIDFNWHNENQNVYGTFTYELYEGERLLGTTKELSYRYGFDRAKDGYPEKSDILDLDLKIKIKNEVHTDEKEIDKDNYNLDQYLSWKVTAPQAMVSAEKDALDFSWHNVNQNVYGDKTYEIYNGERLLGTTKELSYRYRFDRNIDGYPEKSDILALALKIKVQNEVHEAEREIDKDNYNLDKYLTWLSPQVKLSAALAVEEGISVNWQCNQELTYGSLRYDYTIQYEGQEIYKKEGVLAYNDTYSFDRDFDQDGYPEKTGVVASLQALGIDPKGRDIGKYSVEVFAYTLQKQEDITTDTATVRANYYGTWVPASVQQVKAIAYQDRIEVEASAPSTPNDYGTPYRFIFERKKGSADWERFEIDGPAITLPFNREKDGYPEADELATWKFRAKAISTAEKESLTWGGGSDGVALDLDHYGTWRVGNPQVNALTADRTIRLIMSQPPRADNRLPYGTIQYKIQINRPLTDPLNTWFKPSLSLNPYTSEDNYKDGEGYYVASSVYLQTMPLLGQGSGQIENTVYMFRVAAFNEASESEWVEVVATAEATSIKDIVKAKETVKEAYISDLSALSANLGNISQGSLSGNDNNKWDLSTFVDDLGRNHYEGEFRVGGAEQYLHVQPILDTHNMPTGEYNITFKVGAFELSATANRINGELIVMTNAEALDRTRITPTGTYFEHRETSSSDNWKAISQLRTDGLSTESVYSTHSLVITNHDLQTRRKMKTDIGRPYLSNSSKVWHFDTDLLDQYQGQGLEVLGNVDLVDQYNTTDKSLDFTPAILAVAPYAEIGRSAYGQFNAQIGIGSPSVFTVDFWIQYIWAENQVIFDVGNTTDKVRLVVQNDEVYYNDYDPEVDAVPYNQEILNEGDVFVFNEPAAASSTIQHYGQGVNNPPAGHVFTLDGLGIKFEKNTWLHIGIVLTADNMDVYLDTQKVEFPRYSKGASDTQVILNGTQNTFVLDELMIDTTTAELFEDFAENTVKRIPWAALDRKNKQFVLEVDNLITNIFDSGSPFETRVKEIISQMKENGEL